MSYEWTSEPCPNCEELAEYNCIDDTIYCKFCKNYDKVQTMKDPAIIVEIHAAEGGEHSKRLVVQQVKIYSKLAGRRTL